MKTLVLMVSVVSLCACSSMGMSGMGSGSSGAPHTMASSVANDATGIYAGG